jgi:transaldolase
LAAEILATIQGVSHQLMPAGLGTNATLTANASSKLYQAEIHIDRGADRSRRRGKAFSRRKAGAARHTPTSRYVRVLPGGGVRASQVQLISPFVGRIYD